MKAQEAENIKKNPRQQVQVVILLLWGPHMENHCP